MKPINTNKEGCSPISSNCIIWQGPDIECINLCKGDTVSDVVYQLATALCTLLDQVNVNVYDLSCLNLIQQDPADFQKLIQLLIDKICQLEGIEPGSGTPSTGSAGCPDCLVSVAQCLVQNDPISGNPILKEQLTDYVERIGVFICQILESITEIEVNITAIEKVNSDLQIQINQILESIPDPLPQVTPVCVTNNPGTPQDLNVVLEALESEYCDLRTITGTNQALTTAIASLCNGLGTSLITGNPITGWKPTVASVADLLTNMALKICDTTNAITYVLNTCCDTGCSAIDLGFSATMLSSTELRIIYTGTVPSNYTDNLVTPSSIEIIDSTDPGLVDTVPSVNILTDYFNPSQPQIVTLNNVNGENDVTVKVTYRFIDPITQQECQSVVQSLVLGTTACPDVTLTPTFNTVQADFTFAGSIPTTLTAQVFNNAGTVLVSTQTFIVNTPVQSITLGNLTYSTDYKFVLVVSGVPCDFINFTTEDYPCLPPTDISATGDIDDYNPTA